MVARRRPPLHIALFAGALLGACNLAPWQGRAWHKAALHTHTTHSDGERSPAAMVAWYRARGYDIVALTDHNRNVDVDALAALAPGVLLIPGVEYTSRGAGRPVHVNGLFTLRDVRGRSRATAHGVLAAMLRELRRDGALAVVNHPNYGYALRITDLAALPVSHLEIFNASSGALNDGDANAPPVDALWDALLRAGRRVYGIGVDDAHALPGGKNPNVPGRAWTWIYARLDPFDVRAALETGRFYASTGPKLRAWRPGRGGLYARVEPAPGLSYVWEIYGGSATAAVTGPSVWIARPKQGYRRATLFASDGSRLYLQPIFSDE